MSFLGDVLGFEKFNLGDMWSKIKKDPIRLAVGAIDPAMTRVWNQTGIGKNWEPVVDQMGGAYGGSALTLGDTGEGVYGRAQAAGVPTKAGSQLHDVAHVVASALTGNYAAGKLPFLQGGNSNMAVHTHPGSAPTGFAQRFPGPPWLQKLSGGFNKFTGGMMGPTPGGLSQPEQDAYRKQQEMAMIAQLLRATGPRPKGTTGQLQALGGAMQASQAAGSDYLDQLVRSKLAQAQIQRTQQPDRLIGTASPSDFTPESLAKYQQSGDPSDLEPIAKNLFNRFNPRDYTPESLAKFQTTQDPSDLVRVAPYQMANSPGGGLQAFDPISGQVAPPVRTPEQGTAEAAAMARAKAEQGAIGEAMGKAQGALLDKAFKGDQIMGILDIAEPLIDEATGSGTGAGRDALAAFFGVSTTGAQAIAQLKPLQAAIMLNQPRMEGPQSDKDVQLYREAAGQIGDPAVPAATKKAALKVIRQLYAKYTELTTGQSAGSQEDDPLGLR